LRICVSEDAASAHFGASDRLPLIEWLHRFI
jgi:hypothetical protein